MKTRRTAERASTRKHHIIYKVTRDDGAFYIGRHSTNNLDDGYLGSGIRIVRSVEKYGRDAHRFEILESLPSLAAAKEREEQLVSKDLLKDPMCLNLSKGRARGGALGRVPIRLADGTRTTVSSEEFYTNRSKYTAVNEGLVAAIDVKTGKSLLIDRAKLDCVNFVHPSSNRISVRTADGFKSVGKEEFIAGRDRAVNAGKVKGEDNPQAKYIIIFDADGRARHLCRGNFKQVCKEHGLPFAALRNSYATGGVPIYRHARSRADAERNRTTQYIGWFAEAISMKDQLSREDAFRRLIELDQELGLYDADREGH